AGWAVSGHEPCDRECRLCSCLPLKPKSGCETGHGFRTRSQFFERFRAPVSTMVRVSSDASVPMRYWPPDGSLKAAPSSCADINREGGRTERQRFFFGSSGGKLIRSSVERSSAPVRNRIEALRDPQLRYGPGRAETGSERRGNFTSDFCRPA